MTIDRLSDPVLVRVMSFLPICDIIRCTAVSCKFRFNMPPLMQELTVCRVCDFPAGTARPFVNVKIIHFGGNIVEKPGFISGVVPFLASFRSLEKVDFALISLKLRIVLTLQIPEEAGLVFDLDRAAAPFETVVRVLCDAFSANTLSGDVHVDGLFCPRRHPRHDDRDAPPCSLCRRVIETFPLGQLLVTDLNEGMPWLSFGHVNAFEEVNTKPPCLYPQPVANRWMLKAITERPGGSAALEAVIRGGNGDWLPARPTP